MFANDVTRFPKTGLCIQVDTLLNLVPVKRAAPLKKGQEDMSYTGTRDVVKEGEQPADSVSWTSGLENCKVYHSTGFWHRQNPDLTLQPRWQKT